MSATALTSRVAGRPAWRSSGALGVGVAMLWLSVIVLLPLAAAVVHSLDDGLGAFWDAISNRQAVSTLIFTVVVSLFAACVNVVFGTLIAWVLVRDRFPGKRVLNALIDLPFALPTVVAGIVLIALYGHERPLGIDLAFTRASVLLALLFVTLPFVIRSVQPVLIEADREMEEAARSLGAGDFTTFRRIVLPNLAPAIVSGAALAFARAIGEFGSIVLISGNVPFHTQVSSVLIFKLVESDAPTSAAAVSTVLMLVSLVVLLAMRGLGRRGAHA